MTRDKSAQPAQSEHSGQQPDGGASATLTIYEGDTQALNGSTQRLSDSAGAGNSSEMHIYEPVEAEVPSTGLGRRIVLNGPGRRPRVPSALGPLPLKGLKSEQLALIKEYVETGTHGRASEIRGHGLFQTSGHFRIAFASLKSRLLLMGYEVAEYRRYEILPLPASDAKPDAELWNAITKDRASTDPPPSAQELALQAKKSLPLPLSQRKNTEGLTTEQVLICDRISRLQNVGLNGVAPYFGVTDPVLRRRLKRMHLIVDEVRQYRLEVASLLLPSAAPAATTAVVGQAA